MKLKAKSLIIIPVLGTAKNREKKLSLFSPRK